MVTAGGGVSRAPRSRIQASITHTAQPPSLYTSLLPDSQDGGCVRLVSEPVGLLRRTSKSVQLMKATQKKTSWDCQSRVSSMTLT